jgi:catechol 2,3-dioxygenase-like lactoylglutathione lyase family enzyme
MNAIARLGAVSLDAPDPAPLARFYQQVLGLEVMFDSADFVALKGAGVLLTVQRIDGLPEVTWPVGPVPKQIHLELAVDDLDAAEQAVLAAGATKAGDQPAPDRWRVLIDPAGHPFCITTLIPEA